jgi:hypothetical protein
LLQAVRLAGRGIFQLYVAALRGVSGLLAALQLQGAKACRAAAWGAGGHGSGLLAACGHLHAVTVRCC